MKTLVGAVLAGFLLLTVGNNVFVCGNASECATLAESLGCVLLETGSGEKVGVCPVTVNERHSA